LTTDARFRLRGVARRQRAWSAVMHRLAGILLALVILLPNALARSEDKTLVVFAAASMKNALDDIDAAFTAKTGTKVSAS
jgi:molybdate transport system substrate-binding protein